MQFQVCESDDSCQPGAQYTNPRVVVQEHHGAPLLNCSGLVLVRQLIERLGVVRAIDAGVRVLRRCKWYRESDHILTLIFSMISGGNKLQDVNRLGQDDALKRVLGSDRIPHATTIGKFLWRFGNDQQDKQRHGLAELRDTTAAIQQDAFAMLPRERRKVATLDWDSSIHEVYGQKKEGADFAYDNTWSYSALYGTLAETGDVLYLGLREGYRHTSSPSISNLWVEMTQLDAGISGGKAPIHWLARPIALFHPGVYFVAQRVDVGYPPIQTLS